VIPAAEALLDAYAALGCKPPASIPAVRAALHAAREMAPEESDEPAALLFAFASYRRAFPGAWRFMAFAIAAQQARSLGYEIQATRIEYDALLSAIMYRTAAFDDVRAWVVAHVHPLHES